MALQYKFNAIQGTFDLVDILDTSAFAPAVPFFMTDTETFTVAENKQVLYGLPIDNEGGQIILDGYLVDVG